MTPEREAEIRAVLNGDLSADIDAIPLVVARMADDLLDEVDRLRAGIEALARIYDLHTEPFSDDLRALLNPTEGEDHE